MRQKFNPEVGKVLKRLHHPLDVILLCVRWYSAYPLSLRHVEEMIAERGISVDHSTVHRWAIKLLPILEIGVPTHQAQGREELADGRDLHQGKGRVEVFVPCCR
jgi:transposase-like protein